MAQSLILIKNGKSIFLIILQIYISEDWNRLILILYQLLPASFQCTRIWQFPCLILDCSRTFQPPPVWLWTASPRISQSASRYNSSFSTSHWSPYFSAPNPRTFPLQFWYCWSGYWLFRLRRSGRRGRRYRAGFSIFWWARGNLNLFLVLWIVDWWGSFWGGLIWSVWKFSPALLMMFCWSFENPCDFVFHVIFQQWKPVFLTSYQRSFDTKLQKW